MPTVQSCNSGLTPAKEARAHPEDAGSSRLSGGEPAVSTSDLTLRGGKQICTPDPLYNLGGVISVLRVGHGPVI